MNRHPLYSLPAQTFSPPTIMEVGSIDRSRLKIKSHYPARTLDAILIDDANVHLGTGLVTNTNNRPVNETLYLNRAFHREANPIPTGTLTAHRSVGNTAAIVHNVKWANYYHFLIQTGVSLWLLARERPDWLAHLVMPPLPSNYQRLLALIGVPVPLTLPAETTFAVDQAILLETAYTRLATRSGPLLRAYAQHLSAQVPRAPAPTPRKLYISRRDTARRRLANEAEIEAAFEAAGFESLTLEGTALETQIALFRGAETIVAPHGAGLANTIFAAPGTRIVELAPAAHLNPCFLDIARSANHAYEMHVFETPAPALPHAFEWTIAPDYAAKLAAALAD